MMELEEELQKIEALKDEVSSVREQLTSEKVLWANYCARSARNDVLIVSKEREVAELQKRSSKLAQCSPSMNWVGTPPHIEPGPVSYPPHADGATFETPSSVKSLPSLPNPSISVRREPS